MGGRSGRGGVVHEVVSGAVLGAHLRLLLGAVALAASDPERLAAGDGLDGRMTDAGQVAPSTGTTLANRDGGTSSSSESASPITARTRPWTYDVATAPSSRGVGPAAGPRPRHEVVAEQPGDQRLAVVVDGGRVSW